MTALDGSGAYEKALTFGLNDAIQLLLEDEIANVESRFRSGIQASLTNMILCTLFRSHRNLPNNLFFGTDGYRIREFVLSSDDSFEKLFEATLKIIDIFATQGIPAYRRGDEGFFWPLHIMTRDICEAWSAIFTCSETSKAILLGKSQQIGERMKSRANWIIQQLKPLVAKLGRDRPNGLAEDEWYHPIESRVNKFIAMIDHRMKEYGFDVRKFWIVLNMSFPMNFMYLTLASPIAQETIIKGEVLTDEENTELVRELKNYWKEVIEREDLRSEVENQGS